MSILAIMYMVATPLLAKRYSEKGRYYAWLIIIIGLIIPFRPQWGNVLVNVEVPTHTVTTSEQLGGGTLPIITNSTVSLPIGDTAVNNPFFSISWWNVGFAVWLIGAILFATYQIVKHYHFTKTTNRWSENITDERTLSALESLKSEMGIIKPVSIYLCSCISSPMLIGIIKPKILMPTINLAKDELRFILKHELVHYKRKDLLYKLLVLLTTAIHWFNPIVYLSVRAINVLCETSCDSEVVNSTDTDTRQMYSETIIGVVKYQSKLKTALSTNFYGGKKGMKNRISSIMDMSKKRAGAFILCSVLMLTLGTGAVVTANANSPASREIIAPHSAVTESSAIIRNSNERDTTLIEAIAIARAYLGLPVIGGASFYASMNDGIRHFWVNNPNSETGFSEFWIDVTTGEILEFISASTPTPVSANAQEVATNNTTVFEASITIDTNAPTL